ncbi:ATP-binding protein, partial [Cecembia rubra]
GKGHIRYQSSSSNYDHHLVAVFEDQEEKIWAFRQNGDLLKFENIGETPILISQEAQTNISGIFEMEEGIIWTSNAATGITRIDRNTGEKLGTYSRSNGLLSDNIFNIYKDREGNIWIAQSGGVSKLRFNFRAFENFSAQSLSNEKPVLPSSKVNSILVSSRISSPCRLWIGTESGLACVHSNGKSTIFLEKDGLIGDWVNGLGEDAKGRIWIGTTQGLSGIVYDQNLIPKGASDVRSIRINNKGAYLFSIPNTPPIIAFEKLMLPDQKAGKIESFWFPGFRGMLAILNGEIFEFGIESGLPSSLYKSVAIDPLGFVWVGTLDKGIYKSKIPITSGLIDDQAINNSSLFGQFWAQESGGLTNHIEKMVWHKGVLWLGTQLGLIKLDPDTGKLLALYNTDSGLPANNTISFAVSQNDGNFWLGTNKGLTEFDPVRAEVVKTVSKLDGLIDNEVWLYGSVQTDENGQVYFGSGNGLSIYHPYFDQINEVPPLLEFTSIDKASAFEGRNEITFEYAALSFANVAGVKYKTRLIGYEDKWSEPSTIRRLRYTNLPAYFWAKEYILEVMAINESGIESTSPIRYSFYVQPVWALRWWAFLFYLFVFGLLTWLIHDYQRKKVIKKERDAARLREAELHAQTATARSMAAEAEAKALQADVEKKAIELEKIQVLETAYNELKSAQNQLIQAEKMASLGRLATGIAHEIKNPLNFINNFASVTVDLVGELEVAINAQDLEEIEYLISCLKENSSKIEKHGKRADAIVQSMAQHAKVSKSSFDFVDLNSLVENYLDSAIKNKKSKTPEFGVDFSLDLQQNLGKVKLFGQEFGQAVLNIIGNALDAVWSKKKESGSDFEPKLKISTKQVEDFAEIRIADNGLGIPEDIRERIFEPFFTTKPTGEGTGLGLSLAYDIITQSHNGSLTVETEPGSGTVFIIRVPNT